MTLRLLCSALLLSASTTRAETTSAFFPGAAGLGLGLSSEDHHRINAHLAQFPERQDRRLDAQQQSGEPVEYHHDKERRAFTRLSPPSVEGRRSLEAFVAGRRQLADKLRARPDVGVGHEPSTNDKTPLVVGTDDRFTVTAQEMMQFPYTAIGRFANNGGYCTTQMIGEYLAITNRHCLSLSADGELPVSFFNNAYIRFGESQNTWHFTGEIHRVIYSVDSHDYALLQLTEPIGRETGYYNIQSMTYNDFMNQAYQVTVVGYSHDIFNAFNTPSAHYGCTTQGVFPRYHACVFDCDTEGGSSGSAVTLAEWADLSSETGRYVPNGKIPTVVGVNYAGSTLGHLQESYFKPSEVFVDDVAAALQWEVPTPPTPSPTPSPTTFQGGACKDGLSMIDVSDGQAHTFDDGFDNEYPNEWSACWLINRGDETAFNTIELTFAFLDLEYRHDMLLVYNFDENPFATEDTRRRLQENRITAAREITGQDVANELPFAGDGQYVLVRLLTDPTISATGFQVNVQAMHVTPAPTASPVWVDPLQALCQNVVHLDASEIDMLEDPFTSYPNSYHNCWVLDAGEGNHIALTVREYVFENCCDGVNLYGTTEENGVVQSVENPTPLGYYTAAGDIWYSDSRFAVVKMYTDSSVVSSGFKFDVDVLEMGTYIPESAIMCPGGIVEVVATESPEVLPDFSRNETIDSRCWLVDTNSANRFVKLSFQGQEYEYEWGSIALLQVFDLQGVTKVGGVVDWTSETPMHRRKIRNTDVTIHDRYSNSRYALVKLEGFSTLLDASISVLTSKVKRKNIVPPPPFPAPGLRHYCKDGVEILTSHEDVWTRLKDGYVRYPDNFMYCWVLDSGEGGDNMLNITLLEIGIGDGSFSIEGTDHIDNTYSLNQHMYHSSDSWSNLTRSAIVPERYALVRLESSRGQRGSGFKLEHKAIDAVPGLRLCPDGIEYLSATTTPQRFDDGYAFYPTMLRQCWVIENTNAHLQVDFPAFDLENEYDRLNVYEMDGRSQSDYDNAVYKRYFTGNANDVYSVSTERPYLLLRMVTDYSVSGTGFVGEYTSSIHSPTRSPTAPMPTRSPTTPMPTRSPTHATPPPGLDDVATSTWCPDGVTLLQASQTTWALLNNRDYPYENSMSRCWILDSQSNDLNVAVQGSFFAVEHGFDFVSFYTFEELQQQGRNEYTLHGNLTRVDIVTGNSFDDFVSDSRYVLVMLRTDYSVLDAGFGIWYIASPDSSFPELAIPDSCRMGYDLVSSASQFARIHDGFRRYPNNVELCWVLDSGSDANAIEFVLTSLDVEEDYQDQLMLFNLDAVAFDGNGVPTNFGVPERMVFLESDHHHGKPYFSSGRYMLLRFTTDHQVGLGGFQGNHRSLPLVQATPPPTSFGEKWCSGAIRTLVANADGTARRVTDGTGNYPSNAELCWVLDAGDDEKVVALTLSQIDTEETYDFLDILDLDASGMDGNIGDHQFDNVTLVRSFSGSLSNRMVTSSGRHMLMRLTSDSSIQSTGFEGTFRAVNETHGNYVPVPLPVPLPWACRSGLSVLVADPTGEKELVSDGYNRYPNDIGQCWVLDAGPNGDVVQFQLRHFDIESGYDSLQLYQLGSFSYSPEKGAEGVVFTDSLGSFSGLREWSQVFKSRGRFMLLVLETDSIINGEGFRGYYSRSPPLTGISSNDCFADIGKGKCVANVNRELVCGKQIRNNRSCPLTECQRLCLEDDDCIGFDFRKGGRCVLARGTGEITQTSGWGKFTCFARRECGAP